MANYFRIYFGEDGVSVETMTKEKVLEILNDEEDIFSDEMTKRLSPGSGKDCVSWPDHCEPYKSVFIKGEIVNPIAKKVVTKYEID